MSAANGRSAPSERVRRSVAGLLRAALAAMDGTTASKVEAVLLAEQELEASIDALANAPCPVPDGWRLAPLQYDGPMMTAAYAEAKQTSLYKRERDIKSRAFDYCTGYRVMLAAAPAAPQGATP